VGQHSTPDGLGRDRVEVPPELPLSLPERRAATLLIRQILDRAQATARIEGFGQVAVEHSALTSDATVGVMISRQTRRPGRPECWHLVVSEWRDGQRCPARVEEFAAWLSCGWPELDAVDTFVLTHGRHAVIACDPTDDERIQS
jgi:hypothetical protein